MPPAGFEPLIPASERPQTYALDRAARFRNMIQETPNTPIPVGELLNAWVCGRSPAEIVGLNPTGGMDVCLL